MNTCYLHKYPYIFLSFFERESTSNGEGAEREGERENSEHGGLDTTTLRS